MTLSPAQFSAAVSVAINAPVLPEGCHVIQRKGWYQLITPGLKESSANEVMLSQLGSENDLVRTVDETLNMYRELGIPCKWAIGPMSSPAKLEPLVAAQASTSWEFEGMCVSTGVRIKKSSEIIVEPVTQDNFQDFIAINLSGWELKDFRVQTVMRLEKMLYHPQYRSYLALKNGQPIGSAVSLYKNDCACLMSAVVLKDFRGLGAYRELVRVRLMDMEQSGFSYAVTQARSATSAPILKKLKFETAYTAKIYRFDF